MSFLEQAKLAWQLRKAWSEIKKEKSKMDWTITLKKFFRELVFGFISVLGTAALAYFTPENITQAAHTAGVPDSIVVVFVPIIRSGLEVIRNWYKHRNS